MMQNQKTPDQTVPVTSTNAASGNVEAAQIAAKANTVLESIGPALIPRLRDIPDKKDRLLALADMIEQHALVKDNIGFNMGSFFVNEEGNKRMYGFVDQTGHACSTVACIAGWAAISDDPRFTRGETGIERHAMEILGLNLFEAGRLFYADDCGISRTKITDKHAVAVIRHFANTGSVDWGRFNRDGKEYT